MRLIYVSFFQRKSLPAVDRLRPVVRRLLPYGEREERERAREKRSRESRERAERAKRDRERQRQRALLTMTSAPHPAITHCPSSQREGERLSCYQREKGICLSVVVSVSPLISSPFVGLCFYRSRRKREKGLIFNETKIETEFDLPLTLFLVFCFCW
jgi:hypothetical protein